MAMKNTGAPQPPLFPVGPFTVEGAPEGDLREASIDTIEKAPFLLRAAVAGLSDNELDTTYRNWTIRQIVHHLADAQLNAYVRFRLALTENRPTIKTWDENRWSVLADAQRADIELSLRLLEGLHARWTYLLRSLAPEAFERVFHHPTAVAQRLYGYTPEDLGRDTQDVVPLWRMLAYMAWHPRHHTAQIVWVRQHKLRTPGLPRL